MRPLFVFNNDEKDEYFFEVKAAYDSVISKKEDVDKVDFSEVSIDSVERGKYDVVLTNKLSPEWYGFFKKSQVPVVTFNNIDKFETLSDIVIDYLNERQHRYFTGEGFRIGNPDFSILDVLHLVSKAQWDSDFFGFGVGYLSSRNLTDSIMYRVKQFVETHKIKALEYLCNCHDRNSVLCAERNGFHFVDIRMSFVRDLGKKSPDLNTPLPYSFGLASEEHIPRLRKLSDSMYIDSRYYFDKNFPEDRVREFFPLWVEKAVKGTFDHECYCLFDNEIPVAFCSIRYVDETNASIGLFGVDKVLHGKGFGKVLIAKVLNELELKGIKRVTVVTQGRNYSAQRLYQSSGFQTLKVELWYHKWMDVI